MKDTQVLCLAGGIAILAIITVFVCYAADTFPKQPLKPQLLTTVSTQTTSDTTQKATSFTQLRKKKNCGCCSEKLDEFIKEMQQYKTRKKNTRDVRPTSSP